MTTKSLLLATSMLAIAISGQALAGTPIAHKRHIPNEAQIMSADVFQQPEYAFDWLPPQPTGPVEHRYHGGPKSDIY